MLIAATRRQPQETTDTRHINTCHHYDEDVNDEDENDEEKAIERRWERKEERERERALVLQTGPQGVSAKGSKCKSRLTAARAHSLAEPGQAHARNHCARKSEKESSLAGLGAKAPAWQNASEVQHP